METRPILRFADGKKAERAKGTGRTFPSAKKFKPAEQETRLGQIFDRLSQAFSSSDAEKFLRQDPFGIAPERALVFVTKVPLDKFSKVAKNVGFEVVDEFEIDSSGSNSELEPEDEYTRPTLYATIPTQDALKNLLRLWQIFQEGTKFERGSAPWFDLFSMLKELRPWGASDRLNENSISVIEERLPLDDTEESLLELELWPVDNQDKLQIWQNEVVNLVNSHNGRVVSKCNIKDGSFRYNALLVGLSTTYIRRLLKDNTALKGLATLEGIQFILPQTIAQVIPEPTVDDADVESDGNYEKFEDQIPAHALLLDGTPIAGHAALDGGVNIEDILDLSQLSQVKDRFHGTAMASLILRGDLNVAESSHVASKLVSIPILIDVESGAKSHNDQLFIDMVHKALQSAFEGEEPLAPDAFLVNFSIGVFGSNFNGRISPLARLLDWWSYKAGILFVVSAGNVMEPLIIPNMTVTKFNELSITERQELVRKEMKNNRFERTILAPGEVMNGLTIGAISSDLEPTDQSTIDQLTLVHELDEITPALYSAVGLGMFKMIKPDVIAAGGLQWITPFNFNHDIELRLNGNRRTGLNVAVSESGVSKTTKSRGTSCSAALVSHYILNAISELTSEQGPFEENALTRTELALLARAVVVNSAKLPPSAENLYEYEKNTNGEKWRNAIEEVVRYYGNGFVDEKLMKNSPEFGVTLVGLGRVQKDESITFEIPLPPSVSGIRANRELSVTLAWFSPIDPTRARYRLASLEAIAANSEIVYSSDADKEWKLGMKGGKPYSNLIKRGSVWSARHINKEEQIPNFDAEEVLPIRVQCIDSSGGALSPDEKIQFAIAVSFELEDNLNIDVYDQLYDEIQSRLKTRIR